MRTDRRSFLRSLAHAAAAVGAAPAALAAATRPPRRPEADPADEAYREVVKAQFRLRPGIVPMNAANLCPAPFPVTDAVSAWTRDVDADVSFQNRGKFDELHARALGSVARYVGAEPDEVVVTRNTPKVTRPLWRGWSSARGTRSCSGARTTLPTFPRRICARRRGSEASSRSSTVRRRSAPAASAPSGSGTTRA